MSLGTVPLCLQEPYPYVSRNRTSMSLGTGALGDAEGFTLNTGAA
jgi:hypothetical protein